MDKWLVRGLAFAGLMIVVRIVQGTLVNTLQTDAVLISLLALAVVMAAAAIWGWRDGRADATANPDADYRADLAMTWLIAGLVAGGISGVVTWGVSLVYPALFSSGLINELTTFAAFTALLIFTPAIIAVALGRWAVDRRGPAVNTHHSIHEREAGGDGDDRADTDVFAAVEADSVDDATAEDATAEDALVEPNGSDDR